MKIYALSGTWDDYAVIGISLDRKVVEKQKEIIEGRYKAAGNFDPQLKVEELEVTNEYMSLC
jgi:hypothetical protein